MFKLVKATAVVSIATVITIIAGLVRAKFTAVTLGPSGVGIFSQALNFQMLFITISTLGIGLGVTKYVSKYNSQGDKVAIEGVISCAFWMQIIASIISIALIFIMAGMLSKFLFASGAYSLLLSVSAIGIPFFVLAVTSETVLLGFGDYKSFTKAKSLSSILALIPFFAFIYAMKVRGAFIYLALSGIVTFSVYYFLLYKNVPKGIVINIFSAKALGSFRQGVKIFTKNLLSYGAVSFVTGMLGMINVVFLRSLVIQYFGSEANGLYQVVFTMSAYYLLFFTNGLWSYFYPKVSAITDMRKFSIEVNYAIRFCVFGVMPFITGLFLFRYFLIHAVFSRAFAGSSELFAAQLAGDVFFILFYILGTSLLARARLRPYLIFSVLYSAVLISSFLVLKYFIGFKAITVSYLLTNIIMFAVVLFYYLNNMKFILYARNIKLLLSAVAAAAVILFAGPDNFLMGAFKVTLLLFWLFIISRRAEKRKAVKMLSDRFRT